MSSSDESKKPSSNGTDSGSMGWLWRLAVIACVLLVTMFGGTTLVSGARDFVAKLNHLPDLVSDMQQTLNKHGVHAEEHRGDDEKPQKRKEAKESDAGEPRPLSAQSGRAYTKDDWKKIAKAQDFKCAKCKEELETTFYIVESRSASTKPVACCVKCAESMTRARGRS